MNNRMIDNATHFFVFAKFIGTSLIKQLLVSIGTPVSEISHGMLTMSQFNPILTLALCFCNVPFNVIV
jgi:hypothetical protein